MMYKVTAGVWFPYVAICSKNLLEDLRRLAPPKKSARLISSLDSSGFNLNGCQEYLTELPQYLDFYAYGNFGRTLKLKRDKRIRSKLKTITQYQFTIAFENFIDEDYVTEKFFDFLLVGSAPESLGASNVSRSAPEDHCYIDVKDFPNPKILAAYIQHLDQDEKAYSQYFEWKHQPHRESFVETAASCQKGRHPF